MFIRLKEGGGIERFVILRLPTQDNGIFKKIKQLSKQHPELQVLEMDALMETNKPLILYILIFKRSLIAEYFVL